ncbi:7,8-didemethyl-8-hydroxy-5-deazariboflavin synthase subunit CofG [Natroniella sp. ANB-PHB2]|uniref:7,8-didemethyl-8-hydroxy-5-deazariboflavin synthase subunit CofG n=1 Tax=Natroniella sp. ANB-PHB2 TaxID=3384444 RepID=UPI0038D4C4FE
MKVITYSKNIFIPITDFCINECSYCKFRSDLEIAGIMKLEQIKSHLFAAKSAGCKEVLFSCGTQPDKSVKFRQRFRSETGYNSVVELVTAACQKALEIGLIPHTNLGVIDFEALEILAEYNGSMGLMLETTAKVAAHCYSSTKDPSTRLEFIAQAGQLKIPFTTGLLVGIGEEKKDRINSLQALSDLHNKYGHLQEVIIQPVKSTKKGLAGVSLVQLQQLIGLAREIMPPEVAIQVPPNLEIENLKGLIESGVSDLGGISSLTDDYINPEYKWPQLEQLKEELEPKYQLRERLPIYSHFLQEEWLRKRVQVSLQREGWQNGL